MQAFLPELGVCPLEDLLSFRMILFSVVGEVMCDHSLGKLVDMITSSGRVQFSLGSITQQLH